MRIAVLASGAGWHVRDLMRAGAALGHAMEPIDFRLVGSTLPGSDDGLAQFDAVIVRTMPPGSLEQVVFRMDVLHRLHALGRPVLNPPRALEVCIDKYLASAKLAEAGLPIPRTIVCQDSDAALAAFETLGGDVVVKPLFGSEGRGMIRLSDKETAWRVFRAIEQTRGVLYLQEFVHHPGWDLRIFVLDGKPLAAMRRHTQGDWRTNVAQGGVAEAVSLRDADAELALRSAQAVGAVACGVDLLPRPEGGYFVLEVNAVPGWRVLAPTSGVDVAKQIVQHLTRPGQGQHAP